MRRLFFGFLVLFLLVAQTAFASGVKSGASPATIGVNSTITYWSIPFPYNTRDLIVQNNDSTAYVYVDVKNSTTTTVNTGCFLLGPGNELTLYDFITDGVSILYDNKGYSTDTEASPISIIAVY